MAARKLRPKPQTGKPKHLKTTLEKSLAPRLLLQLVIVISKSESLQLYYPRSGHGLPLCGCWVFRFLFFVVTLLVSAETHKGLKSVSGICLSTSLIFIRDEIKTKRTSKACHLYLWPFFLNHINNIIYDLINKFCTTKKSSRLHVFVNFALSVNYFMRETWHWTQMKFLFNTLLFEKL